MMCIFSMVAGPHNTSFSFVASVLCPKDFFKCHNSFCLEVKLVCDGESQCENGEDEINCGKIVFPCVLLFLDRHIPASILLKSISNRYRTDRNPVGPITVRYRLK